MSIRVVSRYLSAASAAVLILLLSACHALSPDRGTSPKAPRERINIDFDWRFNLEDTPAANQPGFDDSDWRLLDLPHDWSIEGDYRENHPAGIAGGFLPTGIGWYRKHLTWRPRQPGGRTLLEFDGVYMNSEVWVNGRYLGKRPYGYISFAYDISDYLKPGNNVIAVRVDHSKAPSGRWYTGSGIYRHVWLTSVAPVHIPLNGTFVRSEKVSAARADLRISTEVSNTRGRNRKLLLRTEVLDAGGRVVAGDTAPVTAVASQTGTVEQRLTLENPQLWSVDTPTLYRVRSRLLAGDQLVDELFTTTGIRTVEIGVERGFVLNGKPLILQGVSMHHDAGPVGAAVPEDVLRRRLEILKAMGVNALRTTHNPFAPEFYRLADEMGFLVMNEAFDGWWQAKAEFDYGLYFDQWWQRDLTAFIRRDRNHPSVVMWSIGNEVKGYTPAQQKKLVNFVGRLDSTRPVTQGRGYAGGHLTIAGFNGHGEYMGAIEKFHQQNPQTPVIGTEMTHTMHTRGVYRSKTRYRTRDNPAPWEVRNKKAGGAKKIWEKIKHKVYPVADLTETEVFEVDNTTYGSSFDNSLVRMPIREEIKIARDLPYMLGTFRWTAFDYLGESFGWPARTANFGVLDLAGFPKGVYYLYQSQWSAEPMVHISPHWTHPGREGVELPVVVYTNQESAELFLNGKSLGEQVMTDAMQLVWKVPYQPGELKVVAKTGGEAVREQTVRTAGAAAGISVRADRKQIRANRRDVVHLEVDIVDSAGNPVPRADNRVVFSVSGPARLIGVENGDILDLDPHKVPARKAFMGKVLGLIQATDTAGDIEVTVSAEGLRSQGVVLRAAAVE